MQTFKKTKKKTNPNETVAGSEGIFVGYVWGTTCEFQGALAIHLRAVVRSGELLLKNLVLRHVTAA